MVWLCTVTTPLLCSSQVFSQVPSPSLGALAEEDESSTKSGTQLEGEDKQSEGDHEEPLDEESAGGREVIYRQALRRSDKEEAEAVAEEMTRRKVVSPSQVTTSGAFFISLVR